MSEQNEQGFDAEEQAAMEAMREDTAPVSEEEQQAAEPVEPEPSESKEPEFKSERDRVDPIEWDKLTREQQEDVARLVREGKPPKGWVPHQAMHSEREKRQAIEERMVALEKQLAPKEEGPPEYKDPLEDPEGHRKWAEWRADKARDDAIAEFTKNSQADQQRQQRLSKAAEAEQAFMETQKDYPQATQHLKQARLNELLGQGYTQEQAIGQMSQEANAIFDMAQQTGFNPAELVYLQAQKYGYKAAQEQSPEPDPEQKIEHLANAQKNARGAGNAGGSAQKGGLTIAQLAETDVNDWDKLDPAEKRKAMGG